MADFDKAFEKLAKKEGGYSNHPNDKGGETYMGICRKYYPNLNLWRVVDSYKNTVTIAQLNTRLKNDISIENEVKRVYKKNYWDVLYLDELDAQRIANMVFEDAVNRGITAAIKTLQNVLKVKVTGRMSKSLLKDIKNYGKSIK